MTPLKSVKIPVSVDEMGIELTPIQNKVFNDYLHQRAQEANITLDFRKMQCYGHDDNIKNVLREVIILAKRDTFAFIEMHPETSHPPKRKPGGYNRNSRSINNSDIPTDEKPSDTENVPSTDFKPAVINCKMFLNFG